MSGTSRDDGTLSWRALWREAEERLSAVASSPQEARWIVADVAGFDDADWIVRIDEPATVRAVAHVDAMVARRAGGEPLQHVLGHWSFRGLDLATDRRALVPRPETEQVVDAALVELDRVGGRSRPTVVVDLGTGTGAIGLSIAAERPRTRVVLTEVDPDAAALTRANVAGLGRAGARVELRVGDWYDALPDELIGAVDLIVSNPPYVAVGVALPPQVADWEPPGALYAGSDGLDAIRRVVAGAPRWLTPEGALVVEHGEDQQDEVAGLAAAAGLVASPGTDAAGRARWVVCRIDRAG